MYLQAIVDVIKFTKESFLVNIYVSTNHLKSSWSVYGNY